MIERYSWNQINRALMDYGMSPSRILRVLSILKKQKRLKRRLTKQEIIRSLR